MGKQEERREEREAREDEKDECVGGLRQEALFFLSLSFCEGRNQRENE